jgi:hypothetical protein
MTHYTEKEVALLLGVRVKALRNWRNRSRAKGTQYGPSCCLSEGNAIHPKATFHAWLTGGLLGIT